VIPRRPGEASRPRVEAGVTLIELISVTAIVLILAGVALPVANTWVKRQKEMELRQALRQIREAIDNFQADVQRVPSMRQTKMNAVNQDGYPEKIEWLYEGYDIGDAAKTRFKYLRRLPRDPITGKREWATRSSHDRPDAHFSDGINIFDVRSNSKAVALDGTKYADW
jgi:general secretion pathway protein G